jgi:hypothetical protein
MNADPSTLTPMTISDAHRAHALGQPWRVRLVFVGPNAANASGRSDKWWEATHSTDPSVHAPTMIRWGRTGAQGQGAAMAPAPALTRAHDKIMKGGYVYDYTVRVAARPPPASLQALVNAATWRSADPMRFLLLAGEHGFIAVDLGPATLPNGTPVPSPVQTFLAADGSVWGLCAINPKSYDYCRLRA